MLELINTFKQPYVSLFVIIVCGILLSKIKFKGIGLGSSGIVIMAILLGNYGLNVPASIEKIGLIMFIFAVGIQAGPGFFESFKTGEARQYLLPVLLTLSLVFLISLGMSYALGFDALLAAGLFSGITTSTPTLAAIVENSSSNSSILTYAVAYPVSLITTILSFRLLPRILKIDVNKEESDYHREVLRIHPKILTKHFEVKNPNIFNKSIEDIKFHQMTNAIITRVQKKNEIISLIPNIDTLLEEDDLLKVIGDKEALESSELILGPPTSLETKISPKESVTSILVTNRKVIGKTLESLNLDGLFGAEITFIRRAGMNLVPRGVTRLRFGDKIQVSVSQDSAPNLIKMLGGIESSTIDFLPISLAIVLGIIIGQLSVSLGDTHIGPGMSGGILFTTLVLGRIGKTGPMLWSIAGKTNQFLRQLGMMFFLCGVGSSVGRNLVAAFTPAGINTILASIAIPLVSITVTSFFILKIQRMNKLRFIGALAGSLTCAAALPTSEEVNNSSVPLTAYSISYPFALLMTIFFGQLFLFLGSYL